MKKILLTGGTGLIGSHLLNILRLEDAEVYATSRQKIIPQASHTIRIDLGENWEGSDLPDDIDIIIHLAQSNHYREFPQKAEDVFNVNLASTVRLLNYARKKGIKQFVLASSGGIYGTAQESFSEDKEIVARKDLGYYLGTRLSSELLAESYVEYMNIICLRFFFVYGEGQRSHMLVPRLVNSVRNGDALQLQGDNGLSINPIHVSDAVRAVRKAMELENSYKLNVGGPEVLSLRQMAEIIGDVVGKTPTFETKTANGDIDLVADITRMKTFLCEPVVSFKQGLTNYIESLSDK